MAVDSRKRQKKLEKQKAEKKAERTTIARRQSLGISARLEAAVRAPILHCCYMEALWESGIGSVLVSRQLSSGNVAFVIFLVDVYCLGVKDIFFNIVPRAIYDEEIYGHLLEQGPVRHFTPECARKLVEGAVAFAAAVELPPHPDYRVGKLIFGDICTDQTVRRSLTWVEMANLVSCRSPRRRSTMPGDHQHAPPRLRPAWVLFHRACLCLCGRMNIIATGRNLPGP